MRISHRVMPNPQAMKEVPMIEAVGRQAHFNMTLFCGS